MEAANQSPGTVDREQLRTAVQLLAKADSATIDAEAIAFVERTYRLLAKVITAYDLSAGEDAFGPRRRERRLVSDRRAKGQRQATHLPPANPQAAFQRLRESASYGGYEPPAFDTRA